MKTKVLIGALAVIALLANLDRLASVWREPSESIEAQTVAKTPETQQQTKPEMEPWLEARIEASRKTLATRHEIDAAVAQYKQKVGALPQFELPPGIFDPIPENETPEQREKRINGYFAHYTPERVQQELKTSQEVHRLQQNLKEEIGETEFEARFPSEPMSPEMIQSMREGMEFVNFPPPEQKTMPIPVFDREGKMTFPAPPPPEK